LDKRGNRTLASSDDAELLGSAPDIYTIVVTTHLVTNFDLEAASITTINFYKALNKKKTHGSTNKSTNLDINVTSTNPSMNVFSNKPKQHPKSTEETENDKSHYLWHQIDSTQEKKFAEKDPLITILQFSIS
jgi:hypothetical protein